MSENYHNTAESFIFDLKLSIDDVWKHYGDEAKCDSLDYAANEEGVMQRDELREIMKGLGRLKKQVDALADDCRDISPS